MATQIFKTYSMVSVKTQNQRQATLVRDTFKQLFYFHTLNLDHIKHQDILKENLINTIL